MVLNITSNKCDIYFFFIELQIPNEGRDGNSYYETITFTALRRVPLDVIINGTQYLLVGAVLFQPPHDTTVDSIGHYTAAIKVNQGFMVYDDMRTKTYHLKSTEEVVIHALLYVQTNDK